MDNLLEPEDHQLNTLRRKGRSPFLLDRPLLVLLPYTHLCRRRKSLGYAYVAVYWVEGEEEEGVH
jgi:hypothetical protein